MEIKEKRNKRLNLKVTESFFKKIIECAAREHRSKSNMIEEMCLRYMENPRELSSRQKAWLEIFTEFENRGADKITEEAVKRALKKAHINATEILKRYS
ncbi:hypothetical protein EPN95_04710 [Patescibacteria group bacterium]|nr:MAG: hypothetical protein EPN95_04710 [Patescibacteria group bacterium]